MKTMNAPLIDYSHQINTAAAAHRAAMARRLRHHNLARFLAFLTTAALAITVGIALGVLAATAHDTVPVLILLVTITAAGSWGLHFLLTRQ